MDSAFPILPLSPLEEIARLVSDSIRLNVPLREDDVAYWKKQLTSKYELQTADVILRGEYRNVFDIGTNKLSVVLCSHNRFTPVFLHSHSFVEVIYVATGSCNNILSKQITLLLSGDLLFIPPKARHGLSVFREDTQVVNFWLDLKYLRHILSLAETPGLLHDFLSSEQPTCLHVRTDHVFSQQVKELCDSVALTKTGLVAWPGYTALQLEARTMLLLVDLLANYADRMQLLTAPVEDDRMTTLLDLMREQVGEVTLQSLSYQLGYSYAYLSRLITQNTGKSFLELRRDLRLQKAAQLLCETDATVEDISYACGYKTSNQFYRQFKAIYGLTPAEYRKGH